MNSMRQVDRSSPDGLWDALDEMEPSARIKLASSLVPFEKALRLCYEAGVEAPTLSASRHAEEDVRCAALFLKRCLNDLRATWLLVRVGYTSQAASIAASLWENALVVSVVAGRAAEIQELQNAGDGEIPWGPIRLAQKLADLWQEETLRKSQPFPDSEREKAWREVYSAYKWLCQIKHPTVRSTIYDAPATTVESGAYVVMAAPDMRDADLVVKATVLTISLSRSLEAVRRFALGTDPHRLVETNSPFWRRFKSAESAALEASRLIRSRPLPFDISDSTVARQWRIGKLIGG